MNANKIINAAIKLATQKNDDYNLIRFKNLLERNLNGQKITMAEYMDVKLYLGHSMD